MSIDGKVTRRMKEEIKASVSVIIPFYSHADWLEEALDSVLNQTMPAYEIIVVNDGSREDLSRVMEKYSLVLFYNQENQGAAAARNLGIEKAHGDIVAFLDSDDLWEPDKLEVQIREMEKNQCVWSASGYTTFGWGKSRYVRPYSSRKLCWEHLYNTARIATPAVAVYRKALDKSKFAVDMKNGQDTFLWFKLANLYRLDVIDRSLVKVRKRENSTCRNTDAWIKTRAVLWNKMTLEEELFPPRRILTKMGYQLASYIWKNRQSASNTCLDKILYLISWGLFKVDDFLLYIKEPDMIRTERNGILGKSRR